MKKTEKLIVFGIVLGVLLICIVGVSSEKQSYTTKGDFYINNNYDEKIKEESNIIIPKNRCIVKSGNPPIVIDEYCEKNEDCYIYAQSI